MPFWSSKVRPTRTETVVRNSAAAEGDDVEVSSWVLFGIQNIRCARDVRREFQSLKMRGKGWKLPLSSFLPPPPLCACLFK